MSDGERIELSPMEVVTALKEATKVQIAANYARLVTPTHDEEGNELPQEEMQEYLNEVFAEQVDEFEATLAQTVTRMATAKAEAATQPSISNDLIVPE